MADDVEDSTPAKAKTKTKKRDIVDDDDTPKSSKTKSKRKRSERDVGPADGDETERALSPQAHSTVHAVTAISQPRAVGEDLIKRVKYSLELADTSEYHFHFPLFRTDFYGNSLIC